MRRRSVEPLLGLGEVKQVCFHSMDNYRLTHQIKTYTHYRKSFTGCNFYFLGSVAFGKHIPRVATSTREQVQTHANPKSRLQGAVRSKLLISSKNRKNYGSQQLYSGKTRSCNIFDVECFFFIWLNNL